MTYEYYKRKILDKIGLGKFGRSSEFKRESFEGKINNLVQNYQNKIDDATSLIEIDTISLKGNIEWREKYIKSIEGIEAEKLSPVEKVRLNQRVKTINSIELEITLLQQRLQECEIIVIIMTESKSRLRGQYTTAIQNIGAGNIIAECINTMENYKNTSIVTEKNTVDKAISNSKNILTIGQKMLNNSGSTDNFNRLVSGTKDNLLSLNVGIK